MHRIVVLIFLGVLAGFGSVMAQKKATGSYFKVMDIQYARFAKDPRLNSLDIYMPKKGSSSPVIIWIHGGSWAFGDKIEVESKPEYFTSRGYIFVSINHRLSPGAKHPDHASDVAHALVWVYNNIIHYSGDKNKIFLMGYSSGAQLATMVLANEAYLSAASGSVDMVKGVVTIDGIGFNIPAIMPDANNKVRDWCQSTFGDKPDLWADASPVTYIKAGATLPPFMIVYAGDNTPTQFDAVNLSRKLSEVQVKNTVTNYAKRSNLSINKELGKEGDKVAEDIDAFLQACLK